MARFTVKPDIDAALIRLERELLASCREWRMNGDSSLNAKQRFLKLFYARGRDRLSPHLHRYYEALRTSTGVDEARLAFFARVADVVADGRLKVRS